MTIDRDLITHPNVAAFLRVIREGESSQGPEAYQTIVGGSRLDSYADHPRQSIFIQRLNLHSTAAGAYQFLARTWDECKTALGLPDFSPASQDLAAVYLIKRRGALEDVLRGDIGAAISKCAREWASLPGSPYGQPTMTLERARAVYLKCGGAWIDLDAAQQPTKAPTMTPFVIPAVVELAKLIPQLGAMFSGSEVAARNVKAAEVVVGAVTKAVGASNAQEAVERVAASPEARAQAATAVQDVWWQISEAGGGGIAGARAAAAPYAMPDGPRFWLNPAFWISCALLLMPFMLLVDVFYVHPSSYDGAIRTQIVTAVLLIVSMVGAYWIGTSFSSARKTELSAVR